MSEREYREVMTASGAHATGWEKMTGTTQGPNPFNVVRDFEAALCAYTGAPFAVTTTSCTDALKLAVAWHLKDKPPHWEKRGNSIIGVRPKIEIPKHTYVGVPMAIIHAGGWPTFRDENWRGDYQLKPLPVWDSARHFWAGMYNLSKQFVCVSFHWSKTLGIQQGGAILHDNPEADRWLRMARFDGRQEGVAPKDQKEWIIGHHAYMSPETAAAGLVRIRNLSRHNEPLLWGPGTGSDYPDLSTLEIFK